MRSSPGPRRRLVAATLLGTALGLGLAERLGRADDGERVTLRWNAPPGCPGERVRAEVDRLLGPSGARPAQPINATATVSGDELRGFRVHLETTAGGPTRVRELKGASCAALADATALILALMIDPGAVAVERDAGPPEDAASLPPAPAATPAPAPTLAPAATPAPPAAPLPPLAPAPGPAPIPAPVRVAAPAPRIAPAPAPQLGAGLFALGALDVGTLPGVSPGVVLGVSLLYGPLRAELAASLWPAHDATLAARPSAGGAVDLYAGSAAACWALLSTRVELGPCLGLEIGRLRAQGFGVTDPSQGSALWAAARAGGAFAYRPTDALPLFLDLRLDLAVPFSRPGFVLSNVGTVHRPSPAAGRALGGVEVRF